MFFHYVFFSNKIVLFVLIFKFLCFLQKIKFVQIEPIESFEKCKKQKNEKRKKTMKEKNKVNVYILVVKKRLILMLLKVKVIQDIIVENTP